MASTSSQNLRRGLAVLTLFLVRGFHTQGGACDVAATTPAPDPVLVADEDPPDVLVQGVPFTLHPEIEVYTEAPIQPYCENTDDEADDDDDTFGCSHHATSGMSQQTCTGNWITTAPDDTYETPANLTATCSPSCTATVNADASLTLTVTAGTSVHLVIGATSPTTGEPLSTAADFEVISDNPCSGTDAGTGG